MNEDTILTAEPAKTTMPTPRTAKSRKAATPKKAGGGKSVTKKSSEEKELTKASSPKGKRNKILAQRGEEASARYLQKRGYDIVARNWACPFGEVDIVARDMDVIVFAEVKTRTSVERGLPEEAVTKAKRARYEKIAMAFLQEYDEVNVQVRFDVLALMVMGEDKAFIRHHINAFGAAG